MSKKKYEQLLEDGKAFAEEICLSDYICLFNIKYFSCGYANYLEYNYNFSHALGIIGRLYKEEFRLTNNSDTHNGIAIISRKANVSKSEIKSIRKSLRLYDNFVYRLPYNFHSIIREMIFLLKDKENDELISRYMRSKRTKMYREVLVERQSNAIEQAKSGCDKSGINNNLAEKLGVIQKNLYILTQTYK